VGSQRKKVNTKHFYSTFPDLALAKNILGQKKKKKKKNKQFFIIMALTVMLLKNLKSNWLHFMPDIEMRN